MTEPAHQEKLLLKRANETGSFGDLVYFRAAKRDLAGVRELRGAPGAAFIHDVLMLSEDPEGWAGVLARLPGEGDPWLYYTCAKFLLGQNRVEDALQVARASLGRNQYDTRVLNLIIKSLVNQGERSLAATLAERSLRLNPYQGDIEHIRKVLEAGEVFHLSLYLDVLPRFEPVGYYIPVFNVEKHVAACLESIFAQNYPIEEVLAVDDGSQDRSVEIIQEYPIKLIRHMENRGLAAARNTAFQNASAAFLGAVDTDATIEPGYTKYAMMELENTAENVVGVGGRLIERHTDTVPDKWRAFHLPQDLGPRRMVSPPMVYGSNNILSREAVLAIGGYDEKRRTNAEDCDLCHRLYHAARALAFIPEAVARHDRRDSAESILRTRWNYDFWYWHDEGAYASLTGLARKGEYIAAVAREYMARDVQSGNTDLLYLSFLCVFAELLQDLRHAERTGLLNPAECRFVAVHLLAVLEHPEARIEEDLRQRIIEDTAHLVLEDAGALGQVRPECGELVRAYSGAAVALCAQITGEQRGHLERR